MPDTPTMESTGPEPSLHLPKRIRRERCPHCGSMYTGRYCYGYPSPDLFEAELSSHGALIIGGCCIGYVRGLKGSIDVDAKYHCHECDRDFGSTAVYKLKGEHHLYDTCTNGAYMVFFSIGGDDGSGYEIELSPGKLRLLASPLTGGASLKNGVEGIAGAILKTRPMDDKSFRAVVRGLFNRLYVGDWKKHYSNPNVVDGIHWQLTIRLIGATKPITIYGENAYPPHFKRLLRLLRPLFLKNGVPSPPPPRRAQNSPKRSKSLLVLPKL